MPQSWIRANEAGEHLNTLLIGQINHLNSVFTQPVNSTTEILRFTDNDFAEVELANQPAAIPAGRERCYNDFVAIVALASGVAEGVGFGVHGGIVLLNTQVVATPEKFTVGIEKRCTDGNAAFGEADSRFGYGHSQKVGSFGRIHVKILAYAESFDSLCARIGEHQRHPKWLFNEEEFTALAKEFWVRMPRNGRCGNETRARNLSRLF